MSEALFFFSLPSFFSLFGPSSSLSSVRKALQNPTMRSLGADVEQNKDCVTVPLISAPPGLKSSSSGSESSAPIGGSMFRSTRRQRRRKYNQPEESRTSGRAAPHAGCALRESGGRGRWPSRVARMAAVDYYAVLELPRSPAPTPDEVQAAYRRLVYQISNLFAALAPWASVACSANGHTD